MRPIVLILALFAIGSQPSGQQLGDQFTLPEDLEISLWAESPMFFNPTNIDVDARGRVWVAEAVNYRGFNTAKAGPAHSRRPAIASSSSRTPTTTAAPTAARSSSRTRTCARRSAWR